MSLTEDFLAALAAEAERRNPETPVSEAFAQALDAYYNSTPASDDAADKD